VSWKRNQVNNSHEARVATIQHALSTAGHFKIDRIEAKKTKVESQGAKHKKQNISQQTVRQFKTAAVTGLIPYGKLTKARNMLDLEEELLSRGVPIDVLPEKIGERKDMLKLLEMERLMDEVGMSEQDAIDHKAFKKLSNASFNLSD